MYMCVCAYACTCTAVVYACYMRACECMRVCVYVCVTVYHFVMVLFLLEMIFDSLKTRSFDHHLMYREKVNTDIKDGPAVIKENLTVFSW